MHGEHNSRPRLRLARVGEEAPDFTLPATDGTVIDLATCRKPVVLVFMRHLA